MTPAEQLEGLTLENGWKVEKVAARKPNATGGHFSTGYIAVNEDGRRGFLKALDYTRAFHSSDTARVLQALTNAYMFEKTLCEKCAHLSRVARAIDSGSINADPRNPFNKVEYLIFELAERDIRAHLDLQGTLDVVFVLNALHHVATGLSQLHNADIAHQDLKPSNVLVYGSAVGSKICDLGRAWDRNAPAPHDAFKIAGDRTYAPIELLYNELPTDQRARRFGCDMYHLGSLIVFLFSRVHINAMVIDNLDPMHRPITWGATYSDVLPFLQAGFDVALKRFGEHVPVFMRDELQQFVSELCNPDPSRRGNSPKRGLNRFTLTRYISRFNRLAHDAEIELIKSMRSISCPHSAMTANVK